MVEQVVDLCLQSQSESLSDLGSLEHAEVHGAHRLAAHPRIPADVTVRSLEESGRVVVVVDPMYGTFAYRIYGASSIKGEVIDQRAIGGGRVCAQADRVNGSQCAS